MSKKTPVVSFHDLCIWKAGNHLCAKAASRSLVGLVSHALVVPKLEKRVARAEWWQRDYVQPN